jgi:hypothetical protein
VHVAVIYNFVAVKGRQMAVILVWCGSQCALWSGNTDGIQYTVLFYNLAIKGIVSWDFDGIFMILSYNSLGVRQLPLDILFSILMFSYSNCIIYDFFSLIITLIRIQNFSQTRFDFGKNGAI